VVGTLKNLVRGVMRLMLWERKKREQGGHHLMGVQRGIRGRKVGLGRKLTRREETRILNIKTPESS